MSGAASVAHGGGARPLRVGAALAGVVLAAVLLFSLGVMTGARVARRAPEPSAGAPPAASATLPEPAAPAVVASAVPPGSLTFYDRLSGAAPPLPAVQPDEPADRPAGGEAGAQLRKLMGTGPYAVQVAAMTDRAEATAMAERLRRQGFPATAVAATAKGRTWYRLRIGSFPSRDAAARAAGILQAELRLDATPVRD